MRRKHRFAGVCLAAVFLCIFLVSQALGAGGISGQEMTVLFTHDLHSCFSPRIQDGGGERGGLARLATLLNQEREARPNALVLDGGDFSSGS